MTLKIKFSSIDLPSNRKFGFFFTFVFSVAATLTYFLNSAYTTLIYAFTAIALIFLITTLVKSNALLPLNKLWMYFGFLLGMIVSPIIIGIIYFGLFTPIAILMRISGRDELNLKFSQKLTYWTTRSEPIESESFKQQF